MAIENTYVGNGITLVSGFDYAAKAPLDSRAVVATEAGLAALVNGSAAYEGMLVYVEENQKTYQYTKVNDELTWKEFGFNSADFAAGIVDNLESDATDKALSAAQGKALKGLIDDNAEDIADHETRIGVLENTITGAMHFVGISTTDPTGESGVTIADKADYEPETGDVVIYKTDETDVEFVFDGTNWVELGDVNEESRRLSALEEIIGDETDGLVKDIADAVTAAGNAVNTASTAASDAATAKSDAATALSTANEAKEAAITAQESATAKASEAAASAASASNAKTAAEQAKADAESARDAAQAAQAIAEGAQSAAAGSADNAAESANQAAGSATLAGQKADAASQSATDAANAKTAAETAKTDAESAKAAAITAQGKAEDAQGAAETAQAKAEAAQEAAEASNTSATAIANAAKTASETATSAVNDIKANYIRVGADNKMYLGMEGTDVIIFDCGGAE